jgi:hypothetical protein
VLQFGAGANVIGLRAHLLTGSEDELDLAAPVVQGLLEALNDLRLVGRGLDGLRIIADHKVRAGTKLLGDGKGFELAGHLACSKQKRAKEGEKVRRIPPVHFEGQLPGRSNAPRFLTVSL